MPYQHIEVERAERVGWLWLDRPDKRNALSADMWENIPRAVQELAEDAEVRAVVVAGRGPSFTVGMDLEMLATFRPEGRSEAEAKAHLYEEIKRLQATMTAFADCPKPVVAAVQGYCLGAGMDLIAACDLRLAAADAIFSIRETKMALVADVGTLQRLPGLVASGHVAEMVYTGRDLDARRAERIGLVNDLYPDVEGLHRAAQSLGEEMAANSPLAVQGSKRVLGASAQMSVEQGLDHVALWNAGFLHSNDFAEALAASSERRPPRFTGT